MNRDLRTLTLSQTYTEAHSDDITSLSFHPSPSLPHVLLSASVDGLLNTYDVRIADEDDSVLSTSQVGTSLVAADWMALKGQEQNVEMKGVWGATTIETLQLWDAEDVSFVFGSFRKRHELIFITLSPFQSSLIADLGDVRDVALQPWRSDYLIGAHYNPSLAGVCILTGTQKYAEKPACRVHTRVLEADAFTRLTFLRRGDVAIINLADPDRWVLEHVLPGVGGRTLGGAGHADIVRCAHLDTKVSLRPASWSPSERARRESLAKDSPCCT